MIHTTTCSRSPEHRTPDSPLLTAPAPDHGAAVDLADDPPSASAPAPVKVLAGRAAPAPRVPRPPTFTEVRARTFRPSTEAARVARNNKMASG